MLCEALHAFLSSVWNLIEVLLWKSYIETNTKIIFYYLVFPPPLGREI